LGDGELLQVAQGRTHGSKGVSDPGPGSGRRVRLHRAVLQHPSSSLDPGLHQPSPVRATAAVSLGWCLRNRQQSTALFDEVDTLIIRVSDYEAAAAWYAAALGLHASFTDPVEGLVVLPLSRGTSLTLWQHK